MMYFGGKSPGLGNGLSEPSDDVGAPQLFEGCAIKSKRSQDFLIVRPRKVSTKASGARKSWKHAVVCDMAEFIVR